MKITGSHELHHPRERVFEALLDPEVLSRTLPGCEDLQQTGENRYEGKLRMKVGPVQGVFQGKVELHDVQAPESYRLDIEGNGAPGFVNGEGTIRLSETEAGTDLHYDIDAKVGGRIASVGQRLVESSAKVITRQGLDGLTAQLDALAPPQEAPSGATPERAATQPGAPAAPSQGQFATGFLKGLLHELAPAGRRWPLVVGALLLIAIVLAVYLRACVP